MHAINALTKNDIATFLNEIGADMAILDYNITMNGDLTDTQKHEYRMELKKLRDHIYDVEKKFS